MRLWRLYSSEYKGTRARFAPVVRGSLVDRAAWAPCWPRSAVEDRSGQWSTLPSVQQRAVARPRQATSKQASNHPTSDRLEPKWLRIAAAAAAAAAHWDLGMSDSKHSLKNRLRP